VLRILYVEDNEGSAYMLRMRLELTDEFEVLVAEDGEKGSEIAAAKRPDLILMDLEMPVVDGWEATRRLKSNPERETCKLLPAGSGRKSRCSTPARTGRSTGPSQLLFFREPPDALFVGGDPLFGR